MGGIATDRLGEDVEAVGTRFCVAVGGFELRTVQHSNGMDIRLSVKDDEKMGYAYQSRWRIAVLKGN